MKVQQRALYDEVMACVEARKNGGPALRLFCSGTAGVGKSYVIRCIADALQLKYGGGLNQRSTPTSLLAAPTGLAAISIGGHTLHSLLGLMVRDGKDCQYVRLTDERRDLRRALFEHAEILIIDEISMVSSVMLIQISNRLKEIKGSNEEFGGMNVLVFGDLLQLPPVRAPPIFKGVNRYLARKMFGAPNLAAVSIRGHTLHSLLGIKVRDGTQHQYEALSDEQRDLRRALFENCKILIIDEISMVSSIVLVQLSNRLKEIKGSSQDFGGVNVLVFGDLLQWPPVRAPPVFKGVNSYMARKFFGGRASGVNKWRQFKFYELTENVRQADDVEFANLLNRMRVGTMTDADISVLKAREIPNPHNHPAMENAASYYVDLMKQDPFAMTLLPMFDQVSLFNEMVMQRLGGTIFILNASDSFLKSNPRKCTRPWQLAKYNINVTTRQADDVADDGGPETAGGLRKTLRLAIGCRVMLKRNVDRVKGFVNGLTGVLERFEEVNGEVWKLGVRLVKQAQ